MRELKQKTTFPISGFSPLCRKPGIIVSFPFLRGIPAGEGVFKVLTRKVLILFSYYAGDRRGSFCQ
jgi:hypothetical protein